MTTETYLLIRTALLKAQTHIEDHIAMGDALGMFSEQLKENKLALEALKRDI